jgi:hypothetical protein
MLAAKKLTGEICCHDFVPILKGNILYLGNLINRGIVDQNVNLPIFLKNLGDRSFNLIFIRNITLLAPVTIATFPLKS